MCHPTFKPVCVFFFVFVECVQDHGGDSQWEWSFPCVRRRHCPVSYYEWGVTLSQTHVHTNLCKTRKVKTLKCFSARRSTCLFSSWLQWILWSLLSRPPTQITTRSFTPLTRHQWVLLFCTPKNGKTHNHCIIVNTFFVCSAAWCRVLQGWSPQQWRGDPVQASGLWDQNPAYRHHPRLGKLCTFRFWLF